MTPVVFFFEDQLEPCWYGRCKPRVFLFELRIPLCQLGWYECVKRTTAGCLRLRSRIAPQMSGLIFQKFNVSCFPLLTLQNGIPFYKQLSPPQLSLKTSRSVLKSSVPLSSSVPSLQTARSPPAESHVSSVPQFSSSAKTARSH